MKRRTLLAATGAGLVPSVAGCLGDNNSDDGTDDSANETDEGTNGDDTNEADEQLLFEDAFSATSQGGFLAIDEAVNTRSEAREAGFILPDGEEAFALDAEVSGDGSWESTDIEFPMLQTETQGFTVEAELEFADGLSGTLTEERMTASGTVNVVIEKPKPSAFFDTHFGNILRDLDVDTLVVAGVSTSGGVRATVLDAISSNFRVVVPQECVADRATVPHEVALFDMDMKFADVTPVEEVIETIESRFDDGNG